MQAELPDPETLRPSAMIDGDHPLVQQFVQTHGRGDSERERAVALGESALAAAKTRLAELEKKPAPKGGKK